MAMTIKSSFVWLAFILVLAGCSGGFSGGFVGGAVKKSDSGGFYGGDSAPINKQRDFDSIPDAIPKHEPLSRTGNKPYTALGKAFRPLNSSNGYVKKGIASWYGTKFHGRRTSSGETYDMWGMTAAHPILPLPTYVEVTNLDTGKKIVVKVNDRGPFLHNRIIDLSYAAARKLGIANHGTGRVEIRALNPDNYFGPDDFAESGSIVGSMDTVESSQPSSVAGEYFIQVGVYSEFGNARSMRNMLRQKGHPIYPNSEQENKAQGAPYKVKVGPFQTVNAASEVKRTLEQLLGQALMLIK